jgi:heme/copper-type cytochrome/quinol oxidase subunit 2
MTKSKKKKAEGRFYTASCEFCGKVFKAKRRWQRFDTDECRYKAWYKAEQARRAAAHGFEDRLRKLEQAAGLAVGGKITG